MILLVSYDLNGHERPRAYEQVKNLIERLATSYRRPLMSQWLVETTQAPDWWTEQMRTVVDSGDYFFICRVTAGQYQGWLPQDVWQWLNPRV